LTIGRRFVGGSTIGSTLGAELVVGVVACDALLLPPRTAITVPAATPSAMQVATKPIATALARTPIVTRWSVPVPDGNTAGGAGRTYSFVSDSRSGAKAQSGGVGCCVRTKRVVVQLPHQPRHG